MTDIAEVPQRTPSPLCNQLLELARRVKEGDAPPEELHQVAREKLAELPVVRRETMARIQAQGEAHARLYGESIRALQDSYVEMERALRETVRFAETGLEDAYEQAVQRLAAAGFSSFQATSAYQQAELAQGPTEMPVLNLVYRLKDGFFAGQVARQDLDAGLDGAVRMARTAAREVRNHEPRMEVKDHLAQAYDRFAEALEQVAGAVDQGADATQAALEAATDSGRSLRGAMEDYNFQVSTAGPTRMAHANLILTLAETHRKGGLPDETLARGIQVFRESLENLEAEVESLSSIPTESGRVAKQVQPTRQAFEAHREALELFGHYLAGDEDQYEPARKSLIEAAEALADCQATFEQIGEMEGKVPCVRCGASNDPCKRSCSRCGAQLIVPSGLAAGAFTLSYQEEGGKAQMTGDLVMTENLARLFETVNLMSEGRMDADDYEDVLLWFDGLVREHLLALPAVPELSREGLTDEQAGQVARAQEHMVQARQDIDVGVHELLEALEVLRNYLDEADKQCLVNGVRRVRDASVRIQGAQRVIDELAEASGAKGR